MTEAGSDSRSSRARRILGIAALVVVAGLVMMGVQVWLVYSDEIEIDPSYGAAFIEMVGQNEASSDDGWSDLLEIASTYQQDVGVHLREIRTDVSREEYNAQYDAVLSAGLTPDVIAQIEAVRVRGACQPTLEPGSNLLSAILEINACGMRDIEVALRDRMRAALAEGRWDDARAAFDRAVYLNDVVHGWPHLCNVFHVAHRHGLIEVVHGRLSGPALPDAMLAWLAERWTALAPAETERLIEGERLLLKDALLRPFGTRGYADAQLDPVEVPDFEGIGSFTSALRSMEPSWSTAFRARYLWPTRDDVERGIDAIFDAASAAYGTIDRTRPFDPGPDAVLGAGHPFDLEAFQRAVDKMARRHNDTNAAYHAVRLLIAIERHRRAHGARPAALEALVPEFIDDIPLDPRSGVGFGYDDTDDPAHPRGFVIRSVGADGTAGTEDDVTW